MSELALYQLTGQYVELLNKLSDGDFDIQTVADTIESTGLTDEIAAKAQGIEMVARTMEMYTPAIDLEIERLQNLKKKRQTAAKALREYLKINMIGADILKIECPYFAISVRQNPAAVEVFEPGLLPAEYMKTPEPPPPAPDKTAIKEALKAGRDVPGARLTHGTRLEIR